MRREAGIWLVAITIFVLFCWGLIALIGSTEGDAKCYKNYTATYTWSAAQDELDKMWEDKVLTVSECSRLEGINARAQFAEDRARLLKHFGRK